MGAWTSHSGFWERSGAPVTIGVRSGRTAVVGVGNHQSTSVQMVRPNGRPAMAQGVCSTASAGSRQYGSGATGRGRERWGPVRLRAGNWLPRPWGGATGRRSTGTVRAAGTRPLGADPDPAQAGGRRRCGRGRAGGWQAAGTVGKRGAAQATRASGTEEDEAAAAQGLGVA